MVRHAHAAADVLRGQLGKVQLRRNSQVIWRRLPLVERHLGETGRPSSGWVVDSVAATRTAVAVGMISHPESGERLVMRVSPGPSGASLERSATASRAVLLALGDSTPFGVVTPFLLLRAGDDTVSVESRLPGASFGAAGLDAETACQRVAEALAPLHRATAAPTAITPELAAEVIAVDQLPIRSAGVVRRLGAVSDWAAKQLQRSNRLVGRTHGDLNLSNALFGMGDSSRVSLVDWDASLARGLPALDGISLVMDVRQHRTGSETGTLVRSVLKDGYTPSEQRLLASFDREATDPIMTWVWWLSFAAHSLQAAPRLRSHPFWLRYNVHSVLAEYRDVEERGRRGRV